RALKKQTFSHGYFRRSKELAMIQGKANRMVEYQDVGHEVEEGGLAFEFGLRLHNLAFQELESIAQLLALGRGKNNAGRWNAADLFGDIVAGAIGADGLASE